MLEGREVRGWETIPALASGHKFLLKNYEMGGGLYEFLLENLERSCRSVSAQLSCKGIQISYAAMNNWRRAILDADKVVETCKHCVK